MSFLTERQRLILDFIEQCQQERGVAPTLREIAEEFGFRSTASSQKHIALLEKKGFLRRERNQKRGLVLQGTALTGVREERVAPEPGAWVPVLGTVAAGYPIESVAEAEQERVRVPESMLRSGPHYVLKVVGDSMVDEGILDGDWVVVQQREQAASGDAVIAMVSGEATLKRLYPHDQDRLRLQPANPAMPPLIVAAAEVRIQGVVVGLLRQY